MDVKDIKQFFQMMEKSNITHFSYEEGDAKFSIKKEFPLPASSAMPAQIVPQMPIIPSPVIHNSPVSEPKPETTIQNDIKKKDNMLSITSPMVGTFYSAANPDSAPFVKIGDKVKNGQVVCIIEAMKLFNEIISEVSGTVEEILVKNATPVEYGQEIFIIKPE